MLELQHAKIILDNYHSLNMHGPCQHGDYVTMYIHQSDHMNVTIYRTYVHNYVYIMVTMSLCTYPIVTIRMSLYNYVHI